MLALALAALLLAADPPQAAPGFDAGNDARPAFAQPRRDRPIDAVTAQLVVARLIHLHLLSSAAEARDPARAAAAIRGFQASVGSKPTGVLDRKTLALLAL